MQRTANTRRALLVYLICMSGFALFAANWEHPFLRLESSLADALVAAVAWLLPIAVFATLGRRVKGRKFELLAIAMAPVVAFGAVAAADEFSAALSIVRNGRDLVFEPIQRIPVRGGSEVVVYRFSCAIGCGVILTARHEKSIGGPFRVVRTVLVTKDSVNMRVADSHILEARDKRIVLLPHVVF